MNIKSKRLGVVLAAATATVALSGIGAGSASALSACGGGNIEGTGSSLQNPAQQIWTSGFNTNAAGCNGALKPKVSYASASSGACLSAFGANTGSLGSTTFAFCGTDDAPSSTQITNINTATSSSALSIPVAQAAIAIVVNPPSGCTISQISPAQLEQVFRGTITQWSGITGASGTCSSAITRVVRNDDSGTTYQLKHYLGVQNMATVHNSLTWTQLQGGTNNRTWPGTVTNSQSGCATAMALPCSGGANSGSGGGDEVRTVAAAGGSIGYAALADARSVYTALVGTSPRLKWIAVTDAFGTGVNPSSNGLSTTKASSNCPTAATTYGTPPSATGAWDNVYITSTSAYPICTLTWDLAVTNYPASLGGVTSGRTVKDYLNYVLATTGGQADFANNDYAILPSDVRTAASTGVGEITG
jgi:ABC-type phosphate transport system substrate-binding protein